MFRSTRRAAALTLAAAAGCISAPLAAQTVRGTVVANGSGQAVEEAAVVLLDSAGGRIGASLADVAGHFAIFAGHAGRYQLRIQRIGFASTLSPIFAVPDSGVVEQRVVVPPIAERLAPLVVRATSGCAAHPGENATAFQLWDEARKALDASVITQDQHRYLLNIARLERRLDPQTLKQVSVRRWSSAGIGERPFVALPADDLARDGYVRIDRSGATFYAPDAEALLADGFLDAHCLRTRLPSGSTSPALVGVAFEPHGTSHHSDIRGTLWLDRATHELRTLEFTYTALPATLSSVGADQLGGRIEFKHIAGGAWIIDKWSIRTRELIRGHPLPGARDQTPVDVVTAVRETGGEVTALEPVTADLDVARGTLRGTVNDSAGLAPLSAIRVLLRDAAAPTPADATGHFEISGLLPGDHTLTIVNPVLAALALGITQTITIHGHDTLGVEFALPSRATLVRTACPDSALGERGALVAGVVTDATTGQPMPGVAIAFSWDPTLVQMTDSNSTIRGVTDGAGAYRACGMPAWAPALVAATDSAGHSAHAVADMTEGDLTVRHLRIARTGPGQPVIPTASLHVRVSNASAQPIPRAEVRLAGTKIVQTVDDSGAAGLGELPAGTQVVDVRAVGFTPYRTTLELAADTRASLAVTLVKQPVVFASVNVRGKGPRTDSFSARRRRGAGFFLDSADLARQAGRRLSDVLGTVPGLSVVSGPEGPAIVSGRTGTIVNTGSAQEHNVAQALSRMPGGPDPASAQGQAKLAKQNCGPAGIAAGPPDPANVNCVNALSPHGCEIGQVRYIVDGHEQMQVQGSIDAEFRPEDIKRIEVYRGASEVPAEYAKMGSDCSVIAIWLKHSPSAQSQ